MKPSLLSDLEPICEARTVKACLMFMSDFIAGGQRLLGNTQSEEQWLFKEASRTNVHLCLKSDTEEQTMQVEVTTSYIAALIDQGT